MESEGLSGVGGDVLDVLVAVIVDASDRIPEDKASKCRRASFRRRMAVSSLALDACC